MPDQSFDMIDDLFLPGLPVELIRATYLNAPGNEIVSGKFASPESSAALVANAFGFFLTKPASLPALPGTSDCGWPAASVALESIVRFPWAGGRHPCLDVLIATTDALIGVESKRYEPFRAKAEAKMSDAYWRPVWGDKMKGYQSCRDSTRVAGRQFARLDVAQLVKHALGLRAAVQKIWKGKSPVLFYLYAEPEHWPDGRSVSLDAQVQHLDELKEFSEIVAGDEVSFRFCSYSELLAAWSSQSDLLIAAHASAVAGRFSS
jgi:hypothetical protein